MRLRILGGISSIVLAAVACSSQPASPVPTPTPEPTIRPLPEPVQTKVREVQAVLARELLLDPAQERRIRAHLENAVGRVYSLSIIPLASEKGRAQLIKLTQDQFETDVLGLLTDEQLPRWDAIRVSVRRSMSRVPIVPATPTPLPASRPPGS